MGQPQILSYTETAPQKFMFTLIQHWIEGREPQEVMSSELNFVSLDGRTPESNNFPDS